MRFLRGIYSFGNPNYARIASWEYAYAHLAGQEPRRLRARTRTSRNSSTGSDRELCTANPCRAALYRTPARFSQLALQKPKSAKYAQNAAASGEPRPTRFPSPFPN
jgi:hypothetical protein